ncbi:leukocyte elastase inhibitor-like [Ostrea edulis]|uniref:leukocyte elastase inhibitor-like n=1 Tax=Ostrea edulis TaxID=37623 RepID=UPI0024AECA5E|nr:leukocyte elastase inhibitor-like [Ostrea edulis]
MPVIEQPGPSNNGLASVVSADEDMADYVYSEVKKKPKHEVTCDNKPIESEEPKMNLVDSHATYCDVSDVQEMNESDENGYQDTPLVQDVDGEEASQGVAISNDDEVPSDFNVLYSPLSISTAIAMVRLGARAETLTQVKVKRCESFLQNCTSYFNTTLEGVDLFKSEETREKINSWVSRHTEHKIQGLIPKGALNSLIFMVQVNANYFNGTGRIGLKLRSLEFCNMPDMLLKTIELPYAGNTLNMLIILPTSLNGLEKLEKSLTVSVIKNALCRFDIDVIL